MLYSLPQGRRLNKALFDPIFEQIDFLKGKFDFFKKNF
jgi:hypothetical protein